MKKWTAIDHTADFAYRAFGKDKAKLFKNAAKGLIHFLVEKEKAEKSSEKKKTLIFKAEDQETLLVDFLRELLYLIEVEKLILTKIISLKIKEKSLKVNLILTKYNELKKKTDIKAITYHNIEIKHKDQYFQTDIICDV
mgnify:CR=1 FL=1